METNSRRWFILPLLLSSLLTSCSFSSDFVVVNASSDPIEVRYMIRWLRDEPFAETRKPAILPVSQMESRKWRELPPEQYAFDRSSRTATVSLQPGDALRIVQGGEYRERSLGDRRDFIIEELRLVDASGGSISFTGDRVYKSFVPVPQPIFGPPVLIVLTYK
jgi:hypothetical protein